MNTKVRTYLLSILIIMPIASYSQIPRIISYQGVLTDTLGTPKPNGIYTFTFRLYEIPTGGTPIWTEIKDLSLTRGLFYTMLGDQTPFSSSVKFDKQYWLGIKVGTEPELPQRVPLTAVGYSLVASRADTATYALSSVVDTSRLASSDWGRLGVSPTLYEGTTPLSSRYAPISGSANYIQTQRSSAQNGYIWLSTGNSNTNTIYAETNNNVYSAVYGKHSGGAQTAIYGTSTSSGFGVWGDSKQSTANGIGVYGSSADSGIGVYGYTKGVAFGATVGFNANSSGTGVLGGGNGWGLWRLLAGSGGSFVGSAYGVAGWSKNTSGLRAGGYFDSNNGQSYVYVGAVTDAGTIRKIEGNGTVNTVMQTRSGMKSLFAPESPEAWFEDVGKGQLAKGHCRIELDPLFLDCITVDDSMPLNVFVQLNDDCKGVYVKTDHTGFDVYELQGGIADAKFTYKVIAKWKGYELERFPKALPRQPSVELSPLTNASESIESNFKRVINAPKQEVKVSKPEFEKEK